MTVGVARRILITTITIDTTITIITADTIKRKNQINRQTRTNADLDQETEIINQLEKGLPMSIIQLIGREIHGFIVTATEILVIRETIGLMARILEKAVEILEATKTPETYLEIAETTKTGITRTGETTKTIRMEETLA